MALFGWGKRNEEEEKEIRILLRPIPRNDIMKFLVRNHDWTDDGESKSKLVDWFVKHIDLSSVKRFAKKYERDYEIKTLNPNQSNVKKVIEKEWKPPKLKGEGKFKIHLYSLLKNRFGSEYVRKEAGEYNADIVVNRKIPIELKYNFGKSGLDRLKRQIEDYKKARNYKNNKIFIVFCGMKNDDGKGMFLKRYKNDKRVRL
jgi:hypothetical protein